MVSDLSFFDTALQEVGKNRRFVSFVAVGLSVSINMIPLCRSGTIHERTRRSSVSRSQATLGRVWASKIRLIKIFDKFKKEAQLLRRPLSGGGPPFIFATPGKNQWRCPGY